MSAPTAAEIRAGIERGWQQKSPESGPTIESEFETGLTACELLFYGELYDHEDLRPSEERRFTELCHNAVKPLEDDLRARIVEAMVAAGVQFAAEFPDAPRGPGSAAA